MVCIPSFKRSLVSDKKKLSSPLEKLPSLLLGREVMCSWVNEHELRTSYMSDSFKCLYHLLSVSNYITSIWPHIHMYEMKIILSYRVRRIREILESSQPSVSYILYLILCFIYFVLLSFGFPLAQLVKNPPAMWETWVRSLGWEDPLEILAWRILWIVWSMGSQRVGHD